MANFILSIDQGTTGSTAIITEASSFKVVSKANFEFPQIYPTPGQVEHNLDEIWSSVEKAVSKAIADAKISKNDIMAIGITNQRETTCAFRKDGSPLANAIVWQDRRTSEFCSQNTDKWNKNFKQHTGLPLDPYFSGTKMRWFLQHKPAILKAKENNDLLFGTIDTYLLYKMTATTAYKTEPSNASRTLLMNLETTSWDQALLDFFGIDKANLPQIQDSFSEFGRTRNIGFLPDGIPITCILGDQQAALFGQAGHAEGSLKCTYGTGAFILLNTGKSKIYSQNGLLTTVAYRHKGSAVYALEGSCYIAGAAVQWLRDNLNLIETSPEIEKLAESITDLSQMKNLLLLPFFTGIGSPYWRSDATAAIVGITRDTGKAHIARACLDGMALSINDSINALVADSPTKVSEIRVDGGASANNLLMQIQANVSNKKIIRPQVIETTAYGVALGSMVGLGEMQMEQIDQLWREDRFFIPKASEYIASKIEQWKAMVKKLYL